MPGKCSFDYSVARLVPRVEREEFINVGVIVSCPSQKFLRVKYDLNEARINAFAPNIDTPQIHEYLKAIEKICAGGKDAGQIGILPARQRFYWLTATRSTIIQCSPVHSGLCEEPQIALEHLFKIMVQIT